MSRGILEENNTKQHDEDVEAFYKMVEDAGKELYPGSKFSKLRFIVRLLHIKFLGRWNNKSFNMLLELFKDVLPEESSLPKNFNASKKWQKVSCMWEWLHIVLERPCDQKCFPNM